MRVGHRRPHSICERAVVQRRVARPHASGLQTVLYRPVVLDLHRIGRVEPELVEIAAGIPPVEVRRLQAAIIIWRRCGHVGHQELVRESNTGARIAVSAAGVAVPMVGARDDRKLLAVVPNAAAMKVWEVLPTWGLVAGEVA